MREGRREDEEIGLGRLDAILGMLLDLQTRIFKSGLHDDTVKLFLSEEVRGRDGDRGAERTDKKRWDGIYASCKV